MDSFNKKDWQVSVVAAWKDLNTDASSVLSAITGSDFFQNSQPTISAIDSSGQIEVKISVPALLLPWITDAYLGDLLLLMFPKTGSDYKVTTSFSEASAYSQILAKKPSVSQSVFQIVSNSSKTTYYSVKTSDPTRSH